METEGASISLADCQPASASALSPTCLIYAEVGKLLSELIVQVCADCSGETYEDPYGDLEVVEDVSSASFGMSASDLAKKIASKTNTRRQVDEPEETFEKEDYIGGALCVFYTDSPFSDFTSSHFLIDGKFYYSMEHFFQIQMLYSFGMFNLAQQLIQIPEAPIFRKTLKQNLRTMVKSGLFDDKMLADWRKANAYKMMKKGNKAKYDQNFTLKEQLIATGERLLIFTSKNDPLLGVGMTEQGFLRFVRSEELRLEDLLDIFTGIKKRPKELGRNYLGLALMDIRADLTGKPSVLTEWRMSRDESKQDSNDAQKSTSAEILEKLERLPVPEKEKENVPEVTVQDVVDAPPPDVVCGETDVNHEVIAGSSIDAVGNSLAGVRNQFSHQDAVPIEPSDSQEANSIATETAPMADEPVTDQSSAKDVEKPVERETIVLPGERRIVFQRKDAKPRVIGAEEAEKERQELEKKNAEKKQEKKSRWNPPTLPPEDPQLSKLSVLERLKTLVIEKPLVNPFSFADERNKQLLAAMKREEEAAAVIKPKEPPRPALPSQEDLALQRGVSSRQPNYLCEPGEVAPPGFIAVSKTDYPKEKLPDYIANIRNPDLEFRGRPAALPNHLLGALRVHEPDPIPPGGRKRPGALSNIPTHASRFKYGTEGMDPISIHRDDFPMLPPGLRRQPPKGHDPMPPVFMVPRVVKAPDGDPEPPKWQPPKDPMRQIIGKAETFMKDVIKRKRLVKKNALKKMDDDSVRLAQKAYHDQQMADAHMEFDDGEEGLNPAAAKRLRLEKEFKAGSALNPIDISEDNDKDKLGREVAMDKVVFPYGMEATLKDLETMGFKAPPIVGDNSSHARNHYPQRDYWLFQFDDPFTAYRHYANRWTLGGKLNLTGKYEDATIGDENDTMVYEDSESSDDEEDAEGRRIRKYRFETKVIYVDTAQYNEYVSWYQSVHGFAPLPEDSGTAQLRQFYQSYRDRVTPAQALEMDPDLRSDAIAAADLYQNPEDYQTLVRWRWMQWEKRVEIEEQQALHRAQVKAEEFEEGATSGAAPVTYESDQQAKDMTDEVVVLNAVFPNHVDRSELHTESTALQHNNSEISVINAEQIQINAENDIYDNVQHQQEIHIVE